MRPDMDKVIVERPRKGGGVRRPKGLRKRERLALADAALSREGYRRRWTYVSCRKHLNEHLAPLRRFLQSQVGRPWHKVHSEICRHLRLDSAVQSHVLDHLWDYVEVNTRLVSPLSLRERGGVRVAAKRLVVCNAKGEPIGESGWWCRQPLFYVCPKSGLLKAVRRTGRKRRSVIGPAYLVIDERRQWRNLSGIWFEIELAPVAGAAPEARDVLLKATVGCLSPWELRETYGNFSFATSKRQLGKREIRLAERRLAELAKVSRR